MVSRITENFFMVKCMVLAASNIIFIFNAFENMGQIELNKAVLKSGSKKCTTYSAITSEIYTLQTKITYI